MPDNELKNILVTGTAGFIGYHLVQRLIKEGYNVTGIDNINSYYDVQLKLDRLIETGIEIPGNPEGKIQSSEHENYSFYKLDLNDREGLEKLFEHESFDVVINLAAQAGVRYSLENPHAYLESNITGFLNILEGCRHHSVDHLIYASSSSVYGDNDEVPFKTSDRVDTPVSLYAATKKSNELMAHTYSHLFEMPATGLRFFTVYGPWGRPDMALFKFADLMTASKPIDVYNHGDMYRDFTYIDDIIESIVRLIPKIPGNEVEKTSGQVKETEKIETSKVPHRVFNIGHGSPVKLMDFIDTLEKNLGITAEKNMMPMQPGDVPRTWADVKDLFEVTGYKPKVSVEAGIAEFIRWYKSYFEK
jgi:UDP-glucuronate 4-epimerase